MKSKTDLCLGKLIYTFNYKRISSTRFESMLCNSDSADRIVMVASRLLGAAAACAILLSFAAGLRKSYWSGCIKGSTVISSSAGN